MDEVARLLLLLAFSGVALTAVGWFASWFSDEGRRLRRALKKVLKAAPHAVLVARGRGKAVGFNFNSDMVAVAWDGGSWCLLYKVDEMVGAELLLDGQVAARAYRGEARRSLEDRGGPQDEVRLRLIFDDPRYPDFDLVLWADGDEHRKRSRSASEAVHEANSWISRTEALLRRPTARPTPTAVVGPPAALPPAPEPELATLPWEDEFEDDDWREEDDAA